MTSEENRVPDERPVDAVDSPARPQYTPMWRALAGMLEKLENYSRRVGSINLIIIVFALISIVLGAMAIAPGTSSSAAPSY